MKFLGDGPAPHRTAQRVGIGLAIGGGVIAAVGAYLWYRGKRSGSQTTLFGGVDSSTKTLGGDSGAVSGTIGSSTVPVVNTVKKGGMVLKHRRKHTLPIKERVGIIQDLVWESVQDPQMRELALAITGNGKRTVTVGKYTFDVQGASCPARDGMCEARAVYNWVRKNIRYTGDVGPVKMGRNGPVEAVDLFQGAKRTIEFGGGDCLPAGTLLLTDQFEFVPIEKIPTGTKIWGRDAWTEVKDVWAKGVLPVDMVYLNNGSSFKATGDHKVYVALCSQHPMGSRPNSQPCSCPMDARVVERIKVSQLEPGMVLVQPDRIAFGTGTMDPDRALVEGLFLSDGWVEDNRFSISGQDGCPKEAQKRRVVEICEKLGIATRWHRKYVTINDKEWALRLAQMGHRAPNKHALSINFDEATAKVLLEGIMADSGKNSNGGGCTFTTTSRVLMLQTRVLQRMFGISCSERYIVDHGGFGENPIHRLGVRDHARSDGRAVKLLRVKEIDRAILHFPVYDITTSDHYVYLPEADVVVSNCDDHSITNVVLMSSLSALNGLHSKVRWAEVRDGIKHRVTATKLLGDYGHVYTVVGLPKNAPKKWIAMDTTLPGDRFGVEAPAARKTDFPA